MDDENGQAMKTQTEYASVSFKSGLDGVLVQCPRPAGRPECNFADFRMCPETDKREFDYFSNSGDLFSRSELLMFLSSE